MSIDEVIKWWQDSQQPIPQESSVDQLMRMVTAGSAVMEKLIILRQALEMARSRFSEMEGIALKAEETEPSWVWGLARKAYAEIGEALKDG